MDDESSAADEFTSHSTFRPLESGRHSSGMFSGAHNLTVSGQTLTNVTNYTTPVVPSDFRMIPLGDIDLQREISVSSTGVVDRQYERQGVRRLYSARLGGQNTTVAIYQGPGAKEEWEQDIARYISVRHPNLVQIRGATNYGGLHATLFHDGECFDLEYVFTVTALCGTTGAVPFFFFWQVFTRTAAQSSILNRLP
ncbi:hypothetical protein B0H19DRAFT_136886 [Mycena capillaripes]|nr:hypothetical protein B0H19DRAFT_136886 [Mycena capillaripes]